MPVVRGLSVSIHTKNGPLTEYGTRRIGSGSITSSFIQSEDNVPFWINFSPSNPFDFRSMLDYRRTTTRYTANTRLPSWGPVSGTWDFSAHIFIDDNPKSDKNLIIDLPRNGRGYDPVVTARGRSCVDRDGVSGEQQWMFKEVGIENYFERLTTNDKTDEDEEWEAISVSEGRGDHTTTMGQIKIQLFRVRQRGMDKTRKPDRPCDTQQQSQASPDVDISHTIGVGKPKPRAFHYVTVDYLDGPKDPWATIIFMYRGKKQLQKMGFTTGTGPSRRNSCGIFEPGSLKSLNSNLNSMGCRDDGASDDQDTPTKKRGPTNYILREGKRPSTSTGNSVESSPSASKSVVIFAVPRLTSNASPPPPWCRTAVLTVPRIKLKRKPSQHTDITSSLSAMSLNAKDKPWQGGTANSKGSGETSPDSDSTDDSLTCLKRLKVKDAGKELIG